MNLEESTNCSSSTLIGVLFQLEVFLPRFKGSVVQLPFGAMFPCYMYPLYASIQA